MEKLLETSHLRELWMAVSQKVRCVLGASAVESIESSTAAEGLPVTSSDPQGHKPSYGGDTELQEALDSLHDSLATANAGRSEVEVLAVTRRSHVALCRALLRAEMYQSSHVKKAADHALEALGLLSRPLHASMPRLQESVTSLRDTSRHLRTRARSVVGPGVAAKLLLLADQAIAGARLLINVVRDLELQPQVQPLHVKAGVGHVLERLRWCLQQVSDIRAVTSEDDAVSEQTECGQFVKLMDEVLSMIERREDAPVKDDIKGACEELLGHAMSVAHVALGNDNDVISNAAQAVLGRVQAMLSGHDEGPAMIDLRRGSLEDALLQLERAVNTALLRLVLEVFSDVCGPLEQLLRERGEVQVSNFDLHVDRVMQAGMFAAACSSDAKRVAGVRSCLASLESLEPELVPSVLALSPSSDVTGPDTLLIHFYAAHWRHEALRLAQLLDQMVDPAAFSQVTAEELGRLLETAVRSSEERQTSEAAGEMVRDARKLMALLKGLSARGEVPSYDTQAMEDISFYIAELKASSRADSSSDKWQRRVTQRARLLTLSVRALANQMHEDTEDIKSLSLVDNVPSDDKQETDDKPPTPAATNNYVFSISSKSMPTSLRFPESVSDLPLDIATPMRRLVDPVVDLTPFVARGKRLCDARSVLYRTPQRNAASLSTLAVPKTAPALPCSRLFNTGGNNVGAEKKLFTDDDDTSLEFNITDVLDGLSGLSDTLRSEISEQDLAPATLRQRDNKIGASVRLRLSTRNKQAVTAKDTIIEPSTLGSVMVSPSLASQVVSISDREADLKFLNDKINRLKLAQ